MPKKTKEYKKLIKDVISYANTLMYKSWDKVKDNIINKFPHVPTQTLKNIIENAYRQTGDTQERGLPNTRREYMIPTFSSSPDTWYHDLLDNGTDGHPRYWYLFLGVNHHYGVSYPLTDKSASSLLEMLEKFVKQYQPIKLISDEERAITSAAITDFMESEDIQYHLINAKYRNHDGLGLMDRFCKTIRQMNHRLLHGKQSTADDTITYKESITPTNMYNILKEYNNSYQKRLDCTPQQMFDDPDKEKEYIFKHLEDQEEKQYENDTDTKVVHISRTQKTYPIKEGFWVRYYKPSDMRIKHDHPSEGAYKVIDQEGSHYTIQAKDGRTKTFTRKDLLLIREGGGLPPGIKEGKTLPEPGIVGRPKKKEQPKLPPKPPPKSKVTAVESHPMLKSTASRRAKRGKQKKY